MTILETATETLRFDRDTGRLLSFRLRAAPARELLASAPDHPVFALQHLDARGEYRRLTSFEAHRRRVRLSAAPQGGQILTLQFDGLGGLPLAVTITVRASRREPGTRWNLTVNNGAGLKIVDVQFPFVVVRPDPDSALLTPFYAGKLLKNPQPETLGPDAPPVWRMGIDNGTSGHYPGGNSAQFMAYGIGRTGLYLACEDPQANIKLIRATHRPPGIRLGLAHVGDWPRRGVRTLEYDVVLRGFTGDWYDAADLYRAWSLRQAWATPLHRRTDIPPWLLDTPAYITLRLQGELDIGPVFPASAFLPLTRALPMLDRLARRLNAPLAVILMAWERGGPWVYPDCFPPVGGEAGLKRFIAQARRRGWPVGSYCNGTRWVTGHYWNEYDGRAYFQKKGGARSVCRTPDGAAWQEAWNRSWRPSYATCMGSDLTRRLAADFIRRLIGWGMESLQFFDQNMGGATFPCFSGEHGHPPVPGKWMAAEMRRLMERFGRLARRAGAVGVIHSTEAPCNETCLPFFQQCDIRVIPPGHTSNYEFLPLYHYLYHECITLQGHMGMGPEPHHLTTRNACNAVLGEIPGAVMTDDGSLLNKDTGNWAPYRPAVGSDREAIAMLRSVLALRRGAGRDFLTLGRMLRPAAVDGADPVVWENQARVHRLPALFDAAWRAPDGRAAVVLANWTDRDRRVSLKDDRLGRRLRIHSSGRRLDEMARNRRCDSATVDVKVPALGCVLVEGIDPRLEEGDS